MGKFFRLIDCGACPLLGVKRRTELVQTKNALSKQFEDPGHAR